MTSANRPTSLDGRTYHVETKPGEMSNRIITVGDPQRASMISQHLDKVLFTHGSHRGFVTITGLYKKLPVSIVAIGMGTPMMDFFVRETRMVVEGPLSIIRFGSCGSVCGARTGDILVGDGAFAITRNYAYFGAEDNTEAVEPYVLSPSVQGDAGLTALVVGEVVRAVGEQRVFCGLVGNADSFYASQGRRGDDFYDANDGLLDKVHKVFPRTVGLEMESHMLFHLASMSTGRMNDQSRSVRAACALMVFADREGNS
ncbi:hypothetical protein GGF43_006748, partial [Coemansia sp. RSA 2618]